VESLVIGNIRRLIDKYNKKGSKLGGDEISLKEKVGYADLINIGKRKWIVFNVIDKDEGSTYFR
jgi:hypothetical protein